MIAQPRFQAVIFDLDGTLLDTLGDIAQCCNAALLAAGCQPVETERYRLLVGQGARNLVRGAARLTHPDWSDAQIDPIYAAYRKSYAAGWHNQTMIYPGVTDLLSRLRQAGIKLAILSNKPDDSTQEMVDHYFPPTQFDACYGQLDTYPIKPDPALALQIARDLGVDPAKVALVGDSGSDMQTAVRAHMTAIGVLWGFREAPELLSGGAQLLAQSADELAGQLLG